MCGACSRLLVNQTPRRICVLVPQRLLSLPVPWQFEGTLLPLSLANPRQPHSWEILVEMSTWQMEAVTSFHKNALLLRKWKLSEVWELNRVIGVCFNRSLVVTAQKFPSLSVPFSYTHNLQAIGELRWLNSLAEQKNVERCCMLCRNLTKNLSIFQQNKNDEPRNNPLQAVGQRSDPYGYQAKFNPFYSFSCVCLVYLTLKSSVKIMQELLGEEKTCLET